MRPFSIISLVIFLSFSGCSEKQHDIEQSELATLLPHTTPIRSIDPEDTAFSDLAPLKYILKDKKIVMLGEQSHGDGATFLAKTRLVKFLHQEMGFDVFAIESGMFECELAGTLIANGFPVETAIKNSVFDIWTASQQFKPLIEYIDRTQHTGRPLRITGFDLQLSGKYGRDSTSTIFQRFLKTVPEIDESDSYTIALIDTLTRRPKQFTAIPDSFHEQFYSGMSKLRRKVEHSAASEKEFWIQELISKETFARFLWNVDWNNPNPKFMNLRDQQMGENLVWLSRVRYSGKKIIVWAASSHIARNRHELVRRKNSDTAMIPLGHHVWQAMGDSVYAIGFTAYEGTMGLRNRNRTVLAKAKPGTFEDIMHHTAYNYAFVNFRHLPDEHWLNDTVKARPFGYTVMQGRWPMMLDGMFYINSMTPSDGIEE